MLYPKASIINYKTFPILRLDKAKVACSSHLMATEVM